MNDTVNPTPAKKLINNVIFVIDQSGSMHYHVASVNKVMKTLVDPLQNAEQGCRVSLYAFDDTIDRPIFQGPPSELANFRSSARGSTALIDATFEAITDHKNLVTLPDEDNSFLVYVITDGAENASRKHNVNELRALIATLDATWTIGAMVPNSTGVHYAKNLGIPAGNIEIWDVQSQQGFEEAGRRLTRSYAGYISARKCGFTGVNTLFVNAKNLDPVKVDASLLKPSNAVELLVKLNEKSFVIRPFVVEHTGKPFTMGSVFYQLTKTEKVQETKELAIMDKDGKKYFGADARSLLGLPTGRIKIRPGDCGDWKVFVQSTSVNRKLLPGTSVLVLES